MPASKKKQSLHKKTAYVVGVGASAGGLKALEQFFENMPQDSGAAFVVIQHLSPDFKSLMNELLGRKTKMGIYKVREGMELEANSIYLIPPGKNLVISEDQLHLLDQKRHNGPQVLYPIDIFFQSLAEKYPERSVGVVLSGTGSDGTRGLQEIHQAGGITLVQDPESAEFDGMPRSAIATNMIDFIAKPAELAQHLFHFLQAPSSSMEFRNEHQLKRSTPQLIQRIIGVLTRDEKFDFSYYKSNTLSRRIQRRCVLSGYQNLEEYLQFIIDSPDERTLLLNDLLISVTRFFRDSGAWEFLETQIIPKIVADASPKKPIRVWVTACSTGEEAYSMAMLIHEALEKANKPSVEAKIFATDVHSVSLEKASQGLYPASIVHDVSAPRLEKYFTRHNDLFEVSRQLREMIIFAPHNLVRDASFTRMNLVSCRNVLIYMQPELQQQVLRSLHFALAPHGILFLGESETLASLDSEFKVLEAKHRFFEKIRDIRLPLPPGTIPPLSTAMQLQNAGRGAVRLDPILSQAFKTFLSDQKTTALIIDPENKLLHVCSDPLKLLQVPEGPITQDMIRMLPTPLQLPVSTAIHRAQRNRTTVEYSQLQVPLEEEAQTFSLKISYQESTPSRHAFMLVIISTIDSSYTLTEAKTTFEPNAEASMRMMQLEEELQKTRETLQATIEELETTNEEQQATNEELVASNEELQSTNEELHAVNEELYTVNSEYQSKIQELTHLNNDIDNLLSSIKIGVIFLDAALNLRKFTPAAQEVFNIVIGDVGRPVIHFSHQLDCPQLFDLLEEAIRTDKSIEQQVTIKRSGQCLLMRIHPYAVDRDNPQGIVLTFVDVDTLHKTQARLQEEILTRQQTEDALKHLNESLERKVEERVAELKSTNLQLIEEIQKRQQVQFFLSQKNAELAAIIRAIPDAVILVDSFYHIQLLNPAFTQLFHIEASQALGESIAQLYAQPDSFIPSDWRAWTQADVKQPLEVQYRNFEGHIFPGETISTSLIDDGGECIGYLAIIRDIRDRKTAEREIERQLAAIEAATVGIGILSPRKHFVYLNPAFANLFGYGKPEELVNYPFCNLHDPASVQLMMQEIWPTLQSEGSWQGELIARHVQGHNFAEEVILTLTPAGDVICICQNITERKELAHQQIIVQSLTRSNKDLEQFAYAASHDLREPLRKVKSFAELLSLTYESKLDDKGQSYLQFIQNGVMRMEDLMKGLLTYSKVGTSTQLMPGVNLNETLEFVLNDLALLIEENNTAITASTLPTVRANQVAMQQLFQNLITNAIRFKQTGSPIIQINAEKQPKSWLISVQDNGIGIEPKFHDRIFALFQQLHNRQEYPGTGLGLALCRKIVENMGGEIWVESELGQGATFYFTVPD